MRFAAPMLALCAVALVAQAPRPTHLRGSAQRVLDGRTTVVTVDVAGERELVRRCRGDLCAGSWFDGRRRWTFGLNQILVPEDGETGDDDALVATALRSAAPTEEALEVPAGPQLVFADDAAARLLPGPVPIARCTVSGRPARCLLDTGSTPSAITLPFAEALGLEPAGELVIQALGSYATGAVRAGPLVVGGARFSAVRLAVAPATSVTPFDVVIGADLLARVRLRLDRAHDRAQVGPPQIDGPGGVALAFHGGVPTVAVTLDGRPAQALLDTGDAATISMGFDEYRSGPAWPIMTRGSVRGIAGADDALEVTVPRVSAGALSLGSTRAIVRRSQHSVHLGIGMWTRCVVLVDEAAQRFGCDV